MKVYDHYILPWVLHLGCASPPIAKQRAKVIPKARGVVLEVGMGTGLNLPYYIPDKIDKLYGLEPAPEMLKHAQSRIAAADFEISIIDLPGEQIPLEDESVDTIVLTFTLCTIPDPLTALAGMKRVLKSDGVLLFCEHGQAPDHRIQKLQNCLNGLWSTCAGGCHLNRDIPALIERAGFEIQGLEKMYLPGTPKFAGYTYWGEATKPFQDVVIP